jgi:hypothetical protein
MFLYRSRYSCGAWYGVCGAHRLRVELFQPRAGGGELVKVRCLDVGAVKSDVLPTEVVGYDVEHVGFRVRRLRAERADVRREAEKNDHHCA